MIVTDSNKDAEAWECDLAFWVHAGAGREGSRCIDLPAFETDVYSGISPHAETEERAGCWLCGRSLTHPPNFIVPAKIVDLAHPFARRAAKHRSNDPP